MPPPGPDSTIRAAPFSQEALAPHERLGAEVPIPRLRRARAQLTSHVVLVSGTNGKTTTTAMLTAILRRAGETVATNGTGANMPGGVLAALESSKPGGLRAAVVEVDEAWLPLLVPYLRPTALVLTNVFRDQLDRFPDPDHVVGLLRSAADHLPSSMPLVANEDDHRLWRSVGHRAIGYGVASATGPPRARPERDPVICAKCSAPLVAGRGSLGHLGVAACGHCGAGANVRAGYVARVVHAAAADQRIALDGRTISLRLGGVHNAYNAAAAYAASRALGVPPAIAARGLEDVRPPFGRGEILHHFGRRFWLTLTKNPVGAATSLEQLALGAKPGVLVLSINDATLDGHDPSWIWDIPRRALRDLGVTVVPTGTRAFDAALWLTYEGLPIAEPLIDPAAALAEAARRTPPGATIPVLANYTAMLEVRRTITGSRLP